MSQHFLVLAENDWSDEFSADSFAILEDTTKEQAVAVLKKFFPRSSFGTGVFG